MPNYIHLLCLKSSAFQVSLDGPYKFPEPEP